MYHEIDEIKAFYVNVALQITHLFAHKAETTEASLLTGS